MPHPDSVLYLVCYDISDDRRRTSVYKLLRGFGDHLQYSVFRCPLTPMSLSVLRSEIECMVQSQTDQVLFVRLGKAANSASWTTIVVGRPVAPPDFSARIF